MTFRFGKILLIFFAISNAAYSMQGVSRFTSSFFSQTILKYFSKFENALMVQGSGGIKGNPEQLKKTLGCDSYILYEPNKQQTTNALCEFAQSDRALVYLHCHGNKKGLFPRAGHADELDCLSWRELLLPFQKRAENLGKLKQFALVVDACQSGEVFQCVPEPLELAQFFGEFSEQSSMVSWTANTSPMKLSGHFMSRSESLVKDFSESFILSLKNSSH